VDSRPGLDALEVKFLPPKANRSKVPYCLTVLYPRVVSFLRVEKNA